MGGQFSKGSFSGKSSCINWDIRHPKGFIFISIEKLPSYQHIILRREVITISEAKYAKIFKRFSNWKDLETDNTAKFSDNTRCKDPDRKMWNSGLCIRIFLTFFGPKRSFFWPFSGQKQVKFWLFSGFDVNFIKNIKKWGEREE